MAGQANSSSRRTMLAAMAIVIVGVLGLDVTTVVTASSASPETSGTTLGPMPDVAAAPQHGLGNAQRIISWSGYKWLVFPPGQKGPEQTELSNSKAAVDVDASGRLHLAITQVHGQWRGAELESLVPMSYGTYSWVVDTATADFAKSTVLGMFSYRPGSIRLTNEIDVEDSQFDHLHGLENAQFAVQPYYAPHHYHGYQVTSSQDELYQQFQWLPGKPGDGIVNFESHAGTSRTAPLLSKWTYQGYSVPTPYNMRLFIDLWLNTNHPPVGGTHSAIIRSFHFSPLA